MSRLTSPPMCPMFAPYTPVAEMNRSDESGLTCRSTLARLSLRVPEKGEIDGTIALQFVFEDQVGGFAAGPV
jgi:hypothetical protein